MFSKDFYAQTSSRNTDSSDEIDFRSVSGGSTNSGKSQEEGSKTRPVDSINLKKYKYPPDGQEEALKTVMSQCEMWTDNTDLAASDEGGDDVAD